MLSGSVLKGLIANTPLSLTSDVGSVTTNANLYSKSETYTKTEVNDKFTHIIGGAPVVLDTLKELSDALGADPNFSTTMLNQYYV